MNVTVDIQDNPSVRLTDVDVGAVPPDAVEFAVEGTIRVPPALLGSFEGRRLRPVAVAVSVDGSTVVVDLGEEATLRLESVDVGVETPDEIPGGATGEGSMIDDVAGAVDDVTRATDDVVEGTETDVGAGAVAFAVEGTIAGVAADAFEALSGGPAEPESITFAVEDPLSTDGGTGDVVLEFTVLGYGVTVLRDGTISVGRGQ